MYGVSKSQGVVEISILRTLSNDGDVAVKWKTKDVTALNGFNYTGGEGQIKFGNGETKNVLKIPIIELGGKEGDILFWIRLYNPEGVAKLEKSVNQTAIGE